MINSFCRCADVSPLIYENGDGLSVNDINAEEKRLWLLLCSIGDPHNLGAIIRYNLSRLNNNCFNDNHLSYRSAYFLGVEKVFTCSPYDCNQSTAPLSPVASRSSSGALEIFTPKIIRQPEAFLEKLNDAGMYVTNLHSFSNITKTLFSIPKYFLLQLKITISRVEDYW